MDAIKRTINNFKNFIFGMKTEQRMKFAASLFMLIGGGALALAAAQNDDEDELIDISDQVEILDNDSEVVDAIDESSVE